jgi:hypothetical protein
MKDLETILSMTPYLTPISKKILPIEQMCPTEGSLMN